MPPLVNTEFSKEIPGDNRLPASEVARELLVGLENDVAEIRVGFTQVLYDMYLQSPEKALLAINGLAVTE